MLSQRVHRVVCIETDKLQDDVHSSFSHCGKIINVLPWETRAEHTSLSYFVEFAEESSVKRARTLQLPDTKVHVVAFSSFLSAHFLSMAQTLPDSSPSTPLTVKQEPREYVRIPQPFSSAGPFDTHTGESSDDPSAEALAPKRKPTRRAGKKVTAQRQREREVLYSTRARLANAGDELSTRPTVNKPLDYGQADSDKENSVKPAVLSGTSSTPVPMPTPPVLVPLLQRLSQIALPSPSSSSSSTPVYIPSPYSVHIGKQPSMPPTTPTPVPIPISRAKPPFPTPHSSVPSPISTQDVDAITSHTPSVVLTFRGERVNCDLESLENDPSGIITVLKATASQCLERDKWMIVAGHYRSKGNVKAAIAVVQAMIDVMMAPPVGMPASDLKPAFLMLTSCYRDLAQQTRPPNGGISSESAEHTRKAAECLRQVYGTHLPAVPAQAVSEYVTAKTSMNVSRTGATPVGPRQRGCLSNTSNLPSPSPESTRAAYSSAHGRENTGSGSILGKRCANPVPDGPAHCRDSSSSSLLGHASNGGHVQMLEREIQALRDRTTEQLTTINQARTAKRKAEEDLGAERSARRRVERDLDEASRSLAAARRGEAYALAQCRAEVEARRAAESRAEEASQDAGRARREAKEKVAEVREGERRARECFGRLGAMFLRAARGDADGSVWKSAFVESGAGLALSGGSEATKEQ